MNQEPKGRIRHVFEILLSINLGLALALARSWDIFPLLEKTKYFFMNYWGLSNYSAGVPAFYTLALAFSVCVFLLLQLVQWAISPNQLLLVGGVMTVGAIPACRFYPILVTYFRTGYFHLDIGMTLLLIELLGAAAVVLIYVRWMNFVSKGFGLVLLVLHYCLWGWIYWRSGSSDALLLIFPIVGFCSSVSWVGYYYSRAATKPITV